MTAAALARQTARSDYETFLMALDTIPAGRYFTVECIRAELDAMQLRPAQVGVLFTRAYRDGFLLATDRIENSPRSSRRGGTARVWRKAPPAGGAR